MLSGWLWQRCILFDDNQIGQIGLLEYAGRRTLNGRHWALGHRLLVIRLEHDRFDGLAELALARNKWLWFVDSCALERSEDRFLKKKPPLKHVI